MAFSRQETALHGRRVWTERGMGRQRRIGLVAVGSGTVPSRRPAARRRLEQIVRERTRALAIGLRRRRFFLGRHFRSRTQRALVRPPMRQSDWPTAGRAQSHTDAAPEIPGWSAPGRLLA